ncbi:MAG: DUF2971 domain-containing protein [Candidatus Omnitrophica bacterium]|nr:DUF2971 domain-containing protein [Candidatus Omnitrophota bacterium]MCB9783791.1 DUF2971 domain-containing protein [Candidatus Omnitrophota bacterium]
MEPVMTCKSKLCEESFSKRDIKCPKCGSLGVSMLYKHRPINDFFWDPLEEGRIWCPSAKSLNDPFEFDFNLLSSSINGHPIIPAELQEAKDEMKKYGVISFVEICDSIIMWSYYSDSHSGVCLGFERNESNFLGKSEKCVPVQYHDTNELPAVLPMDLTQSETVTKIITTKSKEWKHEHEWRMVTYESDKLIEYPGRLARVVFGLKTKDVHRKRVKDILGSDVEYYKVVKGERYFSIGIEPSND